MSYISPLDLLKQEVAKFESAIKHSDDALSKGLITPELNAQHHKNNRGLITIYNRAIKKLVQPKKSYKKYKELKSKFNGKEK